MTSLVIKEKRSATKIILQIKWNVKQETFGSLLLLLCIARESKRLLIMRQVINSINKLNIKKVGATFGYEDKDAWRLRVGCWARVIPGVRYLRLFYDETTLRSWARSCFYAYVSPAVVVVDHAIVALPVYVLWRLWTLEDNKTENNLILYDSRFHVMNIKFCSWLQSNSLEYFIDVKVTPFSVHLSYLHAKFKSIHIYAYTYT